MNFAANFRANTNAVAIRWPQQWVSQQGAQPPYQTRNARSGVALFPGERRFREPLRPLCRAALSIARLDHGHQFNPFHNYVGRQHAFSIIASARFNCETCDAVAAAARGRRCRAQPKPGSDAGERQGVGQLVPDQEAEQDRPDDAGVAEGSDGADLARAQRVDHAQVPGEREHRGEDEGEELSQARHLPGLEHPAAEPRGRHHDLRQHHDEQRRERDVETPRGDVPQGAAQHRRAPPAAPRH